MATIESYETPSGRRYMVRYRQPNRKQTKRRGFRSKRDAQEFAATVEVEKMTGAYVKPSLGRIAIAELAPDWLALKKSYVAPSNYRTLESAWRIHVQPVWGSVRIADVDIDVVEQWIAAMKEKSGATTVIRAYGVLAGILDFAVVKKKRLATNPARGVENLPDKSGKRRVYLSAEDVGRLAQESGQHRALVLTLAYCGIRWGEAVALRVADVQFLRRRLAVHDNAVQIGVMRSGRLRAVRSGRFRCLSSSSMNWRCNARDEAATILCSATAPATYPGRSRQTDGSLGR